MRYHHNQRNYQQGLVQDDWTSEDVHDYDDITQIDEIEEIEQKTGKSSVRQRIDEYLEQRRRKQEDIDPFDDDYYYNE